MSSKNLKNKYERILNKLADHKAELASLTRELKVAKDKLAELGVQPKNAKAKLKSYEKNIEKLTEEIGAKIAEAQKIIE